MSLQPSCGTTTCQHQRGEEEEDPFSINVQKPYQGSQTTSKGKETLWWSSRNEASPKKTTALRKLQEGSGPTLSGHCDQLNEELNQNEPQQDQNHLQCVPGQPVISGQYQRPEIYLWSHQRSSPQRNSQQGLGYILYPAGHAPWWWKLNES